MELWTPVLVTPDTGYKKMPLLIGTNVIRELNLNDFKNAKNDIWRSSISCVTKNQIVEDLIVYSTEDVVVNPSQSVIIRGRVGGNSKETTGVARDQHPNWRIDHATVCSGSQPG